MSDLATGRVLMKDGAWLVSPVDRPAGWEAMGLAEIPTVKPRKQRTVIATKSEHTVERHVTASVSVTEEASEQEEIHSTQPTTIKQIPVEVEAPKMLLSHIPDDPPDYRDLAETALRLYGGPDLDALSFEKLYEDLEYSGERVHAYREAKKLTDELLTDWIARNSAQLRHIGLGSKPIQDLWSIVQQVMWDKRMLEREGKLVCTAHDNDKDLWYNRMRRLIGIPLLVDEKEDT